MIKNIRKVIVGGFLSLSLCLGAVPALAGEKEDYLDTFLSNTYTIMLERESDAEGLNYWKDKILNEEIGILDFLNQILDQDEFSNIKISNTEFIKKNYQLLLNREPDSDGINYWTSKLSEIPSKEEKLGVINEMSHSEEFMGEMDRLSILFKKPEPPKEEVVEVGDSIDVFIKDAYEFLFNRSYDEGGLNFWKQELSSQNKGAIDLINNFISQEEFKARNLSDKEFISAIYEVLFNRSVDNDGLEYWNNIYAKDKSSNMRANIVLEIADSEEFLERIENLNMIFKKIDINLFYSELLTKSNKIRGITSSDLSEIKKGMSFFDIIVKLGRTRDVSNVNSINVAKYIVDGSKEFYFIFSDPSATYKFNPIDVLKAQK